jgi:hypothetical protein
MARRGECGNRRHLQNRDEKPDPGPGNGWTSAGGWAKNGNDTAMLGIKDPAGNYIFEVHTYFDADNSGTHTAVVSPSIGTERLHDFTLWCREHHVRAFLGEFAAPASPEGLRWWRTRSHPWSRTGTYGWASPAGR